MQKNLHKPDEDLISYLNYNHDIYTLEDIKGVLALIPGHNDEDYWYWIIALNDGRYVFTCAWCDYTGWDCQSGGESQFADTPYKATLFAHRIEGMRQPRINLIEQLRGRQPFGLEIIKTVREQ